MASKRARQGRVGERREGEGAEVTICERKGKVDTDDLSEEKRSERGRGRQKQDEKINKEVKGNEK